MKQLDNFKKPLAVVAIIFYLLLLTPNIIVHDVEDSGIISEKQLVPYHDLPNDVQDLLSTQSNYYVVIVNELNSEIQFAVIAAELQYNEGDIIRVSEVSREWFTDSHIFHTKVNQSFNRVLIGEIKGVDFGGWLVEDIVNSGYGSILILSQIDFLMGCIILILTLSYLMHGSVALWNIPGILTCYSFQFFLLNISNTFNQLELSILSILFGLIFIPLIPITVWLKRYEETEIGKNKIIELFTYQKIMISSLQTYLLNKNVNHVATIETSKGIIKFLLFEDKVPITTSNFISLAKSGFYDGLTFHKVVSNSIIQGGDPTNTGTGGSGRTIPLEINPELYHTKGAVGMARAKDLDSASSQFYITLTSLPKLNGEYAVFGQVIEGQTVLSQILEGDVMTRVTIGNK